MLALRPVEPDQPLNQRRSESKHVRWPSPEFHTQPTYPDNDYSAGCCMRRDKPKPVSYEHATFAADRLPQRSSHFANSERPMNRPMASSCRRVAAEQETTLLR